MRRSRHRLDLLPLLDVFMVVLFVFATIQEKRLDETTQQTVTQAERIDALADELATARRELAGRSTDAAAQANAAADRERAEQAEAALARLREESEAAVAALATGDDALRRHDVLVKLLDRYSVFEIEIAGELDDAGAVVNRCCFRTDPMASTWQSCGRVPAEREALRSWLDADLGAALRKTKGGNAMTLVRQDERAAYAIAARLQGLLREAFPDHQIYDEGVTLTKSAVDCEP